MLLLDSSLAQRNNLKKKGRRASCAKGLLGFALTLLLCFVPTLVNAQQERMLTDYVVQVDNPDDFRTECNGATDTNTNYRIEVTADIQFSGLVSVASGSACIVDEDITVTIIGVKSDGSRALIRGEGADGAVAYKLFLIKGNANVVFKNLHMDNGRSSSYGGVFQHVSRI